MTSQDFLVLGRYRLQHSADHAPEVGLRCPYCNHHGTFGSLPSGDTTVGWSDSEEAAVGWSNSVTSTAHTGPSWVNYGPRQCPRSQCRGIVFCVLRETGELLHVFPRETVDWDATNLPEPIVATFEEAIVAEANRCYRASALMTRRALELVCEDQGADGATLVQRLKSLGSKAVIPEPLLQALDQLRLLGNDAAHVNARTYGKVGAEEARLAIDVTKELLKAVYQYADLLRRLQALQRTPPTTDIPT